MNKCAEVLFTASVPVILVSKNLVVRGVEILLFVDLEKYLHWTNSRVRL